jgi:hypothetical protein
LRRHDATDNLKKDAQSNTKIGLVLHSASICSPLGECGLTDRVSPASVKAGATGAHAADVTARLVGCIR